MKKEMSKIDSIKKATKIEQEIYYQQIINELKPTCFSYSFLNNTDDILKQAFYQAFSTYQEETPILFDVFLKQTINKTFFEQATSYLKEKNITLPVSFFQYVQMRILPYDDNDTYYSAMQISEVLGTANLNYFQNLFKQVQKATPEVITSIFPKYKVLQAAKKKRNSDLILLYRTKNELTQAESRILRLYLGEDNIPRQLFEISDLCRISQNKIMIILQNAFSKLEGNAALKKKFLQQYPNCDTYYASRIKQIPLEKKVETTPLEELITPLEYKVLSLYLEDEKEKEGKEIAKEIQIDKKTVLEILESLSKRIKTNSYFKEMIFSHWPKSHANYLKNFPTLFEESQQEKEERVLSFLKDVLRRNKHGAYISKETLCKKYQIHPDSFSTSLKNMLLFLKDPRIFQKAEQQIPLFRNLLEDYLDMHVQDQFSKMQLKIIVCAKQIKKDGSTHFRTMQEISEIISKDSVLFYDDVYVEKQMQLIKQKIELYPALKLKIEKIYDEMKEKVQEQINERNKLKIREKDFIAYLKAQLRQDEHGFYPTQKEIAIQLNIDLQKRKQYSSRLQQLRDLSPLKEILQEEISHFDTRLEDYLDSISTDSLKRREEEIIRLYYYQDQTGKIYVRSYEEVAQMLSKDGLHFDALFVKRKIHAIQNRSYTNQDVKDKIEKAKMKMDKVFIDPEKLFEEKKQKILKNRFELVLPFLKQQLKQDEHGYLPLKSQVTSKGNISNYIQYTLSLLEEEDLKKKLNEEIPHFTALWQYFQENKQGLNSIRKQILESTCDLSEPDSLTYRSFQEIAQIISQNGLHFDAYFVSQELRKTIEYFCDKKEEYLSYLKEHPHISLSQLRKQYFHKRKIKLNYLFEMQIEQDEHGFYRSGSELARITGKTKECMNALIRQNIKRLQEDSFRESFFVEQPQLQEKWNHYLDSLSKNKLSKTQIQILEAFCYIDENKQIVTREIEDIPACISTDTLHFDVVFVNKMIQQILKLWKENAEVKQQFLKEHPQYTPAIIKKLKPKEKRRENKKESERVLSEPRELDLRYLKAQLMPDEHGFFPKQTEVAATLHTTNKVLFNHLEVIRSSMKNEAFHECLKAQIPNFDVLWSAFLDATVKKEFSKQQIKIITSLSEVDEFGIQRERSNQEIAQIISNDVLTYDASYVKAQREVIHRLKRQYPHLKEEFHLLRGEADSTFSSRDIALFKEKYTPQQNGTFKTEEERARTLGVSVRNLQLNEQLFSERLSNPQVASAFFLKRPQLEQDYYIYLNYQGIDHEHIHTNRDALAALQTSSFAPFIVGCSPKQQMALALRLGYCDAKIHSLKDVASSCQMSINEVKVLTNICLQFGRENQETQKTYVKK